MALAASIHRTGRMAMEDKTALAYGLAYQEVMTRLIKRLIADKILTDAAVGDLLLEAGQDLLAKKTEVAGAAAMTVQLLSEAIGVDPEWPE
jgi:hypothetical protein